MYVGNTFFLDLYLFELIFYPFSNFTSSYFFTLSIRYHVSIIWLFDYSYSQLVIYVAISIAI